MFESIMKFFKKINKKEEKDISNSRETAKERLHLVLMQDRANVSADFLELMKQEIIEVIKKYIDVDENAIDVRLTNKENDDGTNGAPALYANIPIVNIKNEVKKENKENIEKLDNKEDKKSTQKSNNKEDKENIEKLDDQEDKMEKEQSQEDIEDTEATENTEDTENIKEIQNERIAKVILESAMYNREEKKDKQSKKEDTNEEKPKSEN